MAVAVDPEIKVSATIERKFTEAQGGYATQSATKSSFDVTITQNMTTIKKKLEFDGIDSLESLHKIARKKMVEWLQSLSVSISGRALHVRKVTVQEEGGQPSATIEYSSAMDGLKAIKAKVDGVSDINAA